ncbi:hypothetical protein IFR05_016335, partial [Cadophora sp. M221]
TVYFDPDSFIAAISSLGASGGGDCPEYGMAGLANSLDKMSSGGSIHLWTDAAAKDVALAQTITQRAEKQKVSIFTYLFTSGSCSTSDGFSFVSLGSGGQSFGDLSPSEAGNTANLAGSLVSENKVEVWKVIVNALNSFKLRHRADGPFAYDIPVDSSMTVLTVSLSGNVVALSLFRPDETEVKAGAADIVITTLSTGAIYTINKPATGLWKVTVSGMTGFSLSVFGTSTLQFDSFDFVESAGANHDGYFPVTSTPVPGTSAIGVAVLDGSFASADFKFRSTGGLFLGKMGLIHGTGDSEFEAPSNHFWGSLTVPSGAFNVYVSGRDTAGTPYQRFLSGILTPVPSNFTNPTNFTSSSTSMTSTPFLNSTTSSPTTTSKWTNSTETGVKTPTSTLFDSTSGFPTTSGASFSTSRVPAYTPGSSGSTSRDHISSSYQPIPTNVATTLTQTVIYYTCSPIETSNSVTYLTSTVTTTIDVPCYSECHIPLPVISPGPTVTSLGHHTSTFPTVAAATALSIQGPSRGSSYGASTSTLSSVNYIFSAEESRGDPPAPTSMELSHIHTASGEGVTYSPSHASIPGPVTHKSSGAPTTNVTSSGPKVLSTVVPNASRRLRSDVISSSFATILIVVMCLL